MRRRDFIGSILGALAFQEVARAQPPRKFARVAVLINTGADESKSLLAAFETRLAELGWRQGQNVEFLVRYANFDPAANRNHAAEVLARRPDAIFAPFPISAVAAKKLTGNVPIVFSLVEDPVALKLVVSLAKPEGNTTGVTTRSGELTGKRLQILKETLPGLKRVGLVRFQGAQGTAEGLANTQEFERSAAQLGLEVVSSELHGDAGAKEVGLAIAELVQKHAEATVGFASLHYYWRREFVDQVARARLPAIYDRVEFVELGGLMSVSVSFEERCRAAARYVDRILRGAKPADLPVEEPTSFPVTVNLKTARALGLTIPQLILLRADRVIE